MEFTTKKQLESLQNDLLLREAELLRQMANRCREDLLIIKEEASKRIARGEMEMYDGDLEMAEDRELLKEAIGLLSQLDDVVEKMLPDWRSSSDLILQISDFYNKVENDDDLGKCI